jgi:hypothetical protein
MSAVRRHRWWRLVERVTGDRGRRDMLIGDAAHAKGAYTDAVIDALRADNDWKTWEVAAVYRPETVAVVNSAGIPFDVTAVPVRDPATLLDALDASFAAWVSAHARASAAGAELDEPVRDAFHVDAAARRADPDRPR